MNSAGQMLRWEFELDEIFSERFWIKKSPGSGRERAAEVPRPAAFLLRTSDDRRGARPAWHDSGVRRIGGAHCRNRSISGLRRSGGACLQGADASHPRAV